MGITVHRSAEGLAADPAFTGAFAPLNAGNRVWLPASAMTALGGTAALANVGAGSQTTPVFGLDAGAIEICGGVVAFPSDWSTFHVDVFWLAVGTGGGVCRFRMDRQPITDGATTDGRTFGGTVEPTGPAQYVAKVTRTLTSISVPSSGVIRLQAERDGSHANDTMTGDMGVIGFLMTKAS